jgi:predicted Zn-dependent peptidase
MRAVVRAIACLVPGALMSAATVAVAAETQAIRVAVPPFERVVLDNGLTLLLMERREIPLIGFQALLRGGALADPRGKEGAASLLALLLEKGAGGRDAFAFADAIAAVGGNWSTTAGLEAVSISGDFLARDQALMVELLADLLQRPRLEPAEFETLRDRRSSSSALRKTPIFRGFYRSTDPPLFSTSTHTRGPSAAASRVSRA